MLCKCQECKGVHDIPGLRAPELRLCERCKEQEILKAWESAIQEDRLFERKRFAQAHGLRFVKIVNSYAFNTQPYPLEYAEHVAVAQGKRGQADGLWSEFKTRTVVTARGIGRDWYQQPLSWRSGFVELFAK